MTPFAYANTAATATRLLQRFGASCVLKRTATGEYDPATGQTPVTVTSLDTTAAVFDFDAKYIDGTMIKQGDKRAYMIPAVTPAQGDALTWRGTDYQVIAVKAVAPAGPVCMYEAQIRG